VTAGTIGRPCGSSFHGDGRSRGALPGSSPRLPGCSQGLGPCGFRPEREPGGPGYQAARLPELSVVRPDPEAAYRAGVYDRSVSGPICRGALWLVRRYLRRPHSRLPGSWRDKDSGRVRARRRHRDGARPATRGRRDLLLGRRRADPDRCPPQTLDAESSPHHPTRAMRIACNYRSPAAARPMFDA
jgi:hypothetical protein